MASTYGIVADKVMHRTLNPVDVGSMPTDPTEKQVSGFGNQVSEKQLKPEACCGALIGIAAKLKPS